MPSHNPPRGPSAALQAALDLDDDKRSYNQFAAQTQYPVLLANLDNSASPVRAALKAYVLHQHQLNRLYIAKLGRNALELQLEAVPLRPQQDSNNQTPSKKRRNKEMPLSSSPRPTKRSRQRRPSVIDLGVGDLDTTPEPKRLTPDATLQSEPSLEPEPNDESKEPSINTAESEPSPQPIQLADFTIDEFLHSAQPPLDHLQSYLLDAGLNTEEDLRSIAEWEDKEIVDFFMTAARQLPEVKSLTMLEIFRLKKHLKTYFASS
ncbi:hypothetical protein CVT24_000095 [Panaeolus cyanescens]|uniref:Uncharacterized protein n=1 Tax=Panaeolus cyanescens TaxID=181874 RepID=A0A409VRW6_9AGAR|nr:hypothetical protein CVT24_000095 [Panaeolus cyanescens]